MQIEKIVLSANNFPDFNPMQKAALKKGALDKNLVISSPTASGKTVVAELSALHSILERKKKVIYTCPLRALASEHFSDFKEKYSKQLNIRAALSTGDFDSSSKYLSRYDIIFTTYEKVDSLIRHKADWLNSIGLLVIDEIHEIDSDRGPTLEMLITKLRLMNPKLQILALSATIPNAKELSKWLSAELVESDFRPVKLKEGVFFSEEIQFNDNNFEEIQIEKEPVPSLIENTLKKEKQALIFANTRKNSESLAKKLSKIVSEKLTAKEKIHLKKLSERILNILEQPTDQCKTLSDLVKQGVAFHNAGLLSKQRKIIEELFKENYLKLISCTPTLAAGVNLPAHTVIIPTLYRYGNYGMERISVREYKQMSGRAGRPKFDKEGRSILLAKSEYEAEDLMDNYINGEIEPIESKLGYESILRMHLLSSIAGNFVFDLESLEKFFSNTFYSQQYGEIKQLFPKLMNLLSELEEMNFIKSTPKTIHTTQLGNRVSELYLDPLSAHNLIQSLKQKKQGELFYIFSLVNTSELSPWLFIPKATEAQLYEELQIKEPLLPIKFEKAMYEDPYFMRKYGNSLLFKEWINETPEQTLMKEYNIRPGQLYNKLQVADWLSYCAFELSKLLELDLHYSPLTKLRKRLKQGVKEELLILTELRHIGRVRARRLYKNNIRSISDLKKIPLEKLSTHLSSKIAAKVKEQLGEKPLKQPQNEQEKLKY